VSELYKFQILLKSDKYTGRLDEDLNMFILLTATIQSSLPNNTKSTHCCVFMVTSLYISHIADGAEGEGHIDILC